MLSIPCSEVRPRVTLMPAWVNAEFSTPSNASERVTKADCAVFHAAKRTGSTGASEEAKR